MKLKENMSSGVKTYKTKIRRVKNVIKFHIFKS